MDWWKTDTEILDDTTKQKLDPRKERDSDQAIELEQASKDFKSGPFFLGQSLGQFVAFLASLVVVGGACLGVGNWIARSGIDAKIKKLEELNAVIEKADDLEAIESKYREAIAKVDATLATAERIRLESTFEQYLGTCQDLIRRVPSDMSKKEIEKLIARADREVEALNELAKTSQAHQKERQLRQLLQLIQVSHDYFAAVSKKSSDKEYSEALSQVQSIELSEMQWLEEEASEFTAYFDFAEGTLKMYLSRFKNEELLGKAIEQFKNVEISDPEIYGRACHNRAYCLNSLFHLEKDSLSPAKAKVKLNEIAKYQKEAFRFMESESLRSMSVNNGADNRMDFADLETTKAKKKVQLWNARKLLDEAKLVEDFHPVVFLTEAECVCEQIQLHGIENMSKREKLNEFDYVIRLLRQSRANRYDFSLNRTPKELLKNSPRLKVLIQLDKNWEAKVQKAVFDDPWTTE